MILYINHLFFMPATHAKGFVHVPERAQTLCAGYMPWEEVSMQGFASVEESVEQKNDVSVYTITLKATLPRRIALSPFQHYVFRLRTANGHDFLLGTHQRPFPHCTQTLHLPSRVSDSSSWSFMVKYTSTFSLLEII